MGVQFEEVLFGVALTIADDVLSTVVNVLVTVVIPVPVAVEAVMVGLAFVLLVRTLITIAVNFGVRAMVYVPVIVIAHAIVTVYVNVIASIIITVVHTGIVHRGIAYCAFIGPIDFIIHPININLIEISINIGISIGDTHINTIPVLALVSGKGS